jgi:uncharacterized protein (DUF58 family)
MAARTTTPGARQFLEPSLLARIGSLELKARVIVEGFLQGLHRSPFRGFSIEFAEYRQYMPGDDPLRIDWKLFARSDRYYVKKFEQETNLPCHLLLDVSASMGYGSTAVTKLEYGTYLAGALAYLLARQRDAVGLLTFDERVRTHLPPSTRPGHLRNLLVMLERTTPGARSDLARPLHDLAEALTRRGLVVVISDLLDEPERTVAGLKHVRARGMEVVVFHVLDPAELTLPFDAPARFRDVETDLEVLTSPRAVRDEYLQRVEAFTSGYERALRSAGIDYCLLDTGKPLDWALMAYLSARRRAL